MIRSTGVLVGLVTLTAALFVLAVASGTVAIAPGETVRALLGSGTGQLDALIRTIRVPRAITALLVGAALAASGLLMQTLFRNPLADPYVLGVSAGASLGVALYIVVSSTVMVGAAGLAAGFGAGLVGIGRLGSIVAAGLGAGAILALVLLLSRWVRSSVTLLVMGVMLGSATTAVVSLIVVWNDPRTAQQFLIWGLGSVDGVAWPDLTIFAPVTGCALLATALLTKPLDALLLGDDYARSMGAHVRRIRGTVMGVAAVLAGVVTAFCGPVGFLGIAVPHLARVLIGTSSHRLLVPTTLLSGAVAGLGCAIASHPPGFGTVIPLNVVTSLVGAPVVIAVLLRSRRLAAGVGL